jgi:hypothetical protein
MQHSPAIDRAVTPAIIFAAVLAFACILAAGVANAEPCFRMARWQEMAAHDWRAIDIDKIVARSGLCIKRVTLPAARAREEVQQGLIDIDMWRPQLELSGMHNVLAVPTELPGFGVALVVRNDLPIAVHSLTDMLPYMLVSAAAYQMAEAIPYIQRYRLEHFSTMDQGFNMLLLHRADGLLLDQGLYRSMIRNGEVDPASFRAPLPVMHTPTYMVVHITRRQLIPILDSAIRKALADGAFSDADENETPG